MKKNIKKFFTLIEVMLVVIILGILATMVMPKLVGRSEEARIMAAKTDINSNIALALDLYEVDNGRYPDTLEELLKKTPTGRGPYLKRKPKDPWGREYKYQVLEDGKNYKLCSDGPNLDTEKDDICNIED